MATNIGTQHGGIDSRAAAFVDQMDTLARRWVVGGVVSSVIGAGLLAGHAFGHLGVVVGFVGVIGGPMFVCMGLWWLWRLPAARDALKLPTLDVRLEVRLLRAGYGARYTNVEIWLPDSDDHALAKLKEMMHWQTPKNLSVTRVPAKLHGVPTRGAMVVVSCQEGVVIGRIGQSHFKQGSPVSGGL